MDCTSATIAAVEVRDVLRGPIQHDQALIVPLTGKRIVAPRARWGAVVTDYGVIQWTPRLYRSLRAATLLREMGFTEAGLQESSPPFAVLIKLDVSVHAEVQDLWRSLAPVRQDKTILPLILFASRKAS